ncbi:MAG: hypothetical protein ACRECJ_06395, partial [Limisphaerales bacterium]
MAANVAGMIGNAFREINRPRFAKFRRGNSPPVVSEVEPWLPIFAFVFVGAGLVSARLCRGTLPRALSFLSPLPRGARPEGPEGVFYRLLFQITSAVFLFILLLTGIALPSTSPASQSPDSAAVIAVDTFDVTEAKMLVIYPKGKRRSLEPARSQEPNRLGSLVSITIDMKYDNVILYDILFHSLESCSNYLAALEKLPDIGGCEDVPRSVYSPEEFKKQYLAFQNNDSLPGYVSLPIGGKNYFYSCYYSEGGEVYFA